MAEIHRLLIHSAEKLVCICDKNQRFLRGKQMNQVSVRSRYSEDGYSIIVGGDGRIVDLGLDSVIKEKYSRCVYQKTIDATGMCVLPGLIDGHTHPVWAGDRVKEFALKLAGATYMDIHKAGGGIHFTVNATRNASEDTLYSLLEGRLKRMMSAGTTTVECKSGYGLDVDTELRMLRVLERAKREIPGIEISSTFCGAHAIPKGMNAEEATLNVIREQIPAVECAMKSGMINVENVDVFCEQGVFSVKQSRCILQAGQRIGLRINFHGDELHPTGSAEMGVQLGAKAISHLEEISNEGMKLMSASGTVAVILPTTAYVLRLKAPPVRDMIDAGVPVALGTDFNPNAFCLSMPMTMHLACIYCHMTMAESLVAATLNAAASLGRSETHGSLEKGKFGDLLVIDTPMWEHLIYQMASHDSLIKYVIKKGQVVVAR